MRHNPAGLRLRVQGQGSAVGHRTPFSPSRDVGPHGARAPPQTLARTRGQPHPLRPPAGSPSADPHDRPNPPDRQAQRQFAGPSGRPGWTRAGGLSPSRGHGTERRRAGPLAATKRQFYQQVPRKSGWLGAFGAAGRAIIGTLTRRPRESFPGFGISSKTPSEWPTKSSRKDCPAR